MTSSNIAVLLNLIGFITGATLYAMLLSMLLRSSKTGLPDSSDHSTSTLPYDYLPLATAILGLFWNVCALAAFGIRDLAISDPPALLDAAAYSALGLLPAVVVHSVIRTGLSWTESKARWLIVVLTYFMSGLASALHFHSAIVANSAPSSSALVMLTLGFGALIIPLLLLTRQKPGWWRGWWVIALSIFAISALHLSHHEGDDYSWPVELIGHHASLPLAIAILYQDYRFALVDTFLKRALTLIVLVSISFGLYMGVAAPLLSKGDQASSDPRAVVTLLAMWVATSLLYPSLRRLINRFVDKVILHRADYTAFRTEVARIAALHEEPEVMLREICSHLKRALTTDGVLLLRSGLIKEDNCATVSKNSWSLLDGEGNSISEHKKLLIIDAIENLRLFPDGSAFIPDLPGVSAAIIIPTAEGPHYAIVIGELSGGRRLLSDDTAMLEAVAVILARRIDALRITHERCEQGLREQQISKLATEAELRALRAQINPHFLFNALTTIGYLIQTSPDRALATLMRLTGMLRGVLRPAGEFVTLNEEMQLIESYLDIERARFEDRLRVTIDVPQDLRSLRIPPLIIQPLVENAIKHGIAPRKSGGEVIVSARLEDALTDDTRPSKILRISVCDTGVGASEIEMAHGRKRGVGINNIEQRLKFYFGPDTTLVVDSRPAVGTTVEARLPVTISEASTLNSAAKRRPA